MRLLTWLRPCFPADTNRLRAYGAPVDKYHRISQKGGRNNLKNEKKCDIVTDASKFGFQKRAQGGG